MREVEEVIRERDEDQNSKVTPRLQTGTPKVNAEEEEVVDFLDLVR